MWCGSVLRLRTLHSAFIHSNSQDHLFKSMNEYLAWYGMVSSYSYLVLVLNRMVPGSESQAGYFASKKRC